MKLKWEYVYGDFVTKTDKYIFRLHLSPKGITSGTEGYVLQVRDKNETGFFTVHEYILMDAREIIDCRKMLENENFEEKCKNTSIIQTLETVEKLLEAYDYI